MTEVQTTKQNGTTANPYAPEAGFSELRFGDIVVDEKFNHRRNYDGIDELAKDLKNQGLLHPLLVEKKGGKYHLVGGFRRHRALKTFLKPEDSVMCNIQTYEEPVQAYFAGLSDNHSDPVTNFELATRLAFVEDKFGTSRKKLSEVTGKSQGEISQLITCLKELSPVVRKAWEDSATQTVSADGNKVVTALNKEYPVAPKGEIPFYRLNSWRKQQDAKKQKTLLEGYLEGFTTDTEWLKSLADEEKATKKEEGTEEKGEGKGEGDSEIVVRPRMKDIKDAVAKLSEKKEKDKSLSESDEGKYKALRWVIGDISRM
jgi:ParB/RepB/Spo0J family partition protein